MSPSSNNSYQVNNNPEPSYLPPNHQPFSEGDTNDDLNNKFDTKKTLLKISFVTFVATFDFSIYFFLTDLLTLNFFSEPHNEFVAFLQFIGLVAAGFIARPIGGYLIARYGDNNGRKLALLVTTSIFLLTTLITAILPTYSQVGILSPIALIIIRVLQGAAFGGQFILSWVYIAETIKSSRLNIGISFVCTMALLGPVMCAFTSGLLQFYLNSDDYINFGWRIIFIISALMSMISLYLIRDIAETPIFLENLKLLLDHPKKIRNKISLKPFNSIFWASLLSLIFSNLLTLTVIIIPKLIKLQYSIEASMLRTANILGMLSMAGGALFYGWLSKKTGIGKALILGSILLAAQSFIFFYYLSQFGGSYIILMYSLLGFSMGVVSLCIILILKLFPISNRLKPIAIIFNTMSVFSGAFLPIFILYTTAISRFSPAIYLLFISFMIFLLGLHSTHSINMKNPVNN